jgi:uncharacterized protein YihD (DUF1040 family)
MTKSINALENQKQIDSRVNLLYLLQKLSEQAGRDRVKSRAESLTTNEQIET